MCGAQVSVCLVICLFGACVCVCVCVCAAVTIYAIPCEGVCVRVSGPWLAPSQREKRELERPRTMCRYRSRDRDERHRVLTFYLPVFTTVRGVDALSVTVLMLE